MRLNWLLIMALTTSLFLSACATDDSSDAVSQAKTNFANQNYELAFKEIQAPAAQGDAESQYALGYMYYYGKGTQMNHALGKEWIKKAADGGDSNAQQAYQMIVTQEQKNLTIPTNSATRTASTAAPVALAPVTVAPVHHRAQAAPTTSKLAGNALPLTGDEQAILKAPSYEYTLQLSNALSSNAAKSYIQRHHLGKAAKYYARNVQGQKTYTIIYGHYSSRNAALKALHKLPSAVREAKPWPRPLSSVQTEIRASR